MHLYSLIWLIFFNVMFEALTLETHKLFLVFVLVHCKRHALHFYSVSKWALFLLPVFD